MKEKIGSEIKIIEYEKALKELEERLKFEELISRLSARFLNLPASKINSEINNALKDITVLLDMGRSSIHEIIEEDNSFILNFGYSIPGVEPMPSFITEAHFPWAASQISIGHIINVSCVEDIPPEYTIDIENYLKYCLKNELTVPMQIEGVTVGGLNLAIDKEDFFWPEELKKQLILLGNIIASAIGRRNAEERNRKLKEELLQVTRWVTIGELSASVTHELNQPLCSIITNAETGLRFISGSKVDVDEVNSILEDIASAAHRADSVIKSLRKMFTRKEDKFKKMSIDKIINSSFELVKGNISIRGIRVSMELLEQESFILGDEVKLQQVIINLIINGIEAMSGIKREEKEMIIGTEKNDENNIRIFVKDRGKGIKKIDFNKIFLPFYTTKPCGMGMGLSIVKTIIEEHNGELKAENNPDGGATFSFTVPVVKERGHGTLLYVIDDDLMVRKSITRFLKSEGYRIKSFASGEDFLKEKYYEEPSCIILDVNLPSISGLELQEKLKSLKVFLPIIFISGENSISDSVKAIKNGGFDFLCKPFKNKDLLRTVDRALNVNMNNKRERERIKKLASLFNKLTVREKEIFQLITSGLLNKQAAIKLKITEHTIKMHRRNIMKKMKAESLAELIKMSTLINSNLIQI